MSTIKFKIAAKTDVGRVRENNEDNFQAASDLTTLPMRWVNDRECMLGSKGALLVVADGMGGMNAGEVASEIAIDTIRDYFQPEHITDEIVCTRYTIERFMKSAIIEADNRIKTMARERPETHGMGTTIVIAWLFDKHLYVSWCGDSRAYIYNPVYGLRPLTRDHSYVQDLVDRGAISPEDAFDYPDSNIITRSLSDASTKARPDCLLMPHELCDGDVVLLCTDGLNGMIRDEEIEQVVATHYDNMDRCADALIQAACDASGHDNVTVALCHILAGGGVASSDKLPAGQLPGVRRGAEEMGEDGGSTLKPRRGRKWILGMIGVAVCLMIGAAIGFYVGRKGPAPDPVANDTLPSSRRDSVDILGNTKTGTPPAGSGDTTDSIKAGNSVKDNQTNLNAKDTTRKTGKKEKRAPLGNENHPTAEDPRDPNVLTPVENPRDPNVLTPVENSSGNELTPLNKPDENERMPVGSVKNPEDPNPDQEEEDPIQEYTVQANESLYGIAKKFGVTEEEITQLNNISDPRKIKAGQILKIPRKKE